MQQVAVSLAPDHSVTLPLWEDGVMLAEEDWQISEGLRAELMEWQRAWENFPYGSRDHDLEALRSQFVARGHRLGARLQDELGDRYLVTVQPGI